MSEKKRRRRKIEIEDKRTRHEEEGDGTSPQDMSRINEQLREFHTGAADQARASVEEATDWEAQAAEYLDLAQRKEAELRNYRKRVQQDLADARRFAVEELLYDLFPALDGLAQAAQTYKDTADGENPLLDGVRRTARALESALSRHGIEKIAETGVPFDAEQHQPLTVDEDEETEQELVVEVYVEGYRLGDKVLKPAQVRVVKPADK